MASHGTAPGGDGAPHDYLFGTGSDLGLAQVRYIETLLDAATVDMLDDVVRPGARCLEILLDPRSAAGSTSS